MDIIDLKISKEYRKISVKKFSYLWNKKNFEIKL